MKNKIKEDLKNLSQMITVSGTEQESIEYLKSRLEKCCDKVEITGIGNVIAVKKGKLPGPKVLISAHMDEIGFAIQNIMPNGFLKFEKVGGFEDDLLPARKVLIQGKNGKISGVIGMRAAHLPSGGKLTSKTAYIDIGAASKQEAIDMGVFIGAKAVIQSDFMELNSPDLICTKSIDNKISCAILLNLIENIDADELKGEFYAVFSTLEETTIAGMVPIYNYIDPDYTIVLDTVPCGDVPDINTEMELPVYMGKGPVMIVSQGVPGGGRYNSINPKIRELLCMASEKSDVTMQELAISDSYYVTEESMAYQCGSKGVPAATLAIPRRYSHTPIELLNMNDAEKAYQLLMQLVEINDAVKMTFI